jgi:DNA polymerase III subunit epsilon
MSLKPSLKFWIFLLAIVAAIFAVILGSFIGSWVSLDPAERQLVHGIFGKLFPFPLLGALLLVVIIGTLVSLLFKYYVIPILQLAEKARLITTVNPGYRIAPSGAREVRHLTAVINDAAEAYQHLQLDVDARIEATRAELNEERNRLAALVSELPSGVLVCNTGGQILLYNQQARALLQRTEGRGTLTGTWIGLGRSIFGALDRAPIAAGLEVQQQAASEGRPAPPASFLTTLADGTCLRVKLAPVFHPGNQYVELSGFVLTLEDMTRQIAAKTRQEQVIHELDETLAAALADLRRTARAAAGISPGGGPVAEGIETAVRTITTRLQQARKDHARQLPPAGLQEVIPAGDLLQVLRQALAEQTGIEVRIVAVEPLQLHLDSLALTRALADFATRLRDRFPLEHLELRLAAAAAEKAQLEVTWVGPGLPRELLEEWGDSPLVNGPQGEPLGFATLLAAQGGALQIDAGPGESCTRLTLLLPTGAEGHVPALHPAHQERPVFYEFDLFGQPPGEGTGCKLLRDLTYVVFDTETTGLNPAAGDEVIQLGAIRIVKGKMLRDEIIDQLIDPRRSVPASSVAIHGIPPELLVGQPTFAEILPQFRAFVEGAVLVAHNAAFDMRFLYMQKARTGIVFDQPVLDTLLLSSVVHPNLKTHTLDAIAERFDIPLVGRHTALGDAIVTAEVLLKLIPLLEAQGVHTLEEAIAAAAKSPYARISLDQPRPPRNPESR